MELRNLDEIFTLSSQKKRKSVMAVADAGKASVIDAVLEATFEGLVNPILVGDTQKIKELLRERGQNPSDFSVVKTAETQTSAETAVDIIKSGQADFLMKGMVETSDLLRPVVKKENGLRTGRTISHVPLYQLPFGSAGNCILASRWLVMFQELVFLLYSPLGQPLQRNVSLVLHWRASSQIGINNASS